MIVLLRHLIPLGISRSVFPSTALALWGLNTILRVLRIVYFNLGGSRKTRQGFLTHFTDGPAENRVSAMRLNIRLRKTMEVYPGQYLYLFMSDMGTTRRFQAYPYIITWWDNSLNASELSFLIEPQNGMSADLLTRNSLRTVTIDRPYGKNLHLEDRETVILVAYGIGIAGILLHVRHITYRRLSKQLDHESYRRGLLTRKVDVFWVLEDNGQEEWVSDWIAEL